MYTQADLDSATQLIKALADMNPSADPHGLMDRPFTEACGNWSPEREPTPPLTLEEWKTLTRDNNDVGAAFSRDIQDAENALVFLVVLRDRLVHTAGSTDGIIQVISAVTNPFINARTMTWRTPEEDNTPKAPVVDVDEIELPSVETLMSLKDRKALDLLFRTVDDALWAGDPAQDWSHIDSWVSNIDPNDLTTGLIVGMLSILLPMRDRNQSWYTTWYHRAETVLKAREPAQRVERLLTGFQPKT
jgi:hypothetical protein